MPFRRIQACWLACTRPAGSEDPPQVRAHCPDHLSTRTHASLDTQSPPAPAPSTRHDDHLGASHYTAATAVRPYPRTPPFTRNHIPRPSPARTVQRPTRTNRTAHTTASTANGTLATVNAVSPGDLPPRSAPGDAVAVHSPGPCPILVGAASGSASAWACPLYLSSRCRLVGLCCV